MAAPSRDADPEWRQTAEDREEAAEGTGLVRAVLIRVRFSRPVGEGSNGLQPQSANGSLPPGISPHGGACPSRQEHYRHHLGADRTARRRVRLATGTSPQR